MKPWDIYTWDFLGIGLHPAVIIGTDERVRRKPLVNVLLCSSQRATRAPGANELILDSADGLDWPTLCKCDLVYDASIEELTQKRGSVSPMRRRQIAELVIRGLGFAGL